jgi:hemerythrin superfamily protein
MGIGVAHEGVGDDQPLWKEGFMTDVFSLLEQDHRKVESLFQSFQGSNDPEVALQICRELTVHAMIEEELIYPVVATKVGVEMATEARREHDEAKQLISQIENGVGAGEDVSGLVGQLQEAVQHHVQEEENDIFPTLYKAVPETIDSMGDEVEQRKETLWAQMADAEDRNQPPSVVGNKATVTPSSPEE